MEQIERRCRDYRKEGKILLKRKWKVMTGANIICELVLFIIVSLVLIISIAPFLMFPNLSDTLMIPVTGAVVLFVTAAELMLIFPFDLGISKMNIRLFDGEAVSVKNIFSGFRFFKKAVGLGIWIVIFVMLWSMLFIVPGIIASLRYSQSFFILADNPEKTIRECVNESKALMADKKWLFFKLNLSYMGWAVLATVPTSFFSGFIAGYGIDAGVSIGVSAFIMIIEAICTAILTTYINAGFVVFYKELVNKGNGEL